MTIVFINEQHTILSEQEQILNQKFHDWEFCKVPAEGWTLSEMDNIINSFLRQGEDFVPDNFVFISPIPAMMIKLHDISIDRAERIFFEGKHSHTNNFRILTFHNDKREKKELPNGKIISVVAQTGWQLV